MLVIRADIFRVFSTLAVISCYYYSQRHSGKTTVFSPGNRRKDAHIPFYFGIHAEYLQKKLSIRQTVIQIFT